jgi:peptidoglycan biosynthesis protein MviN/MurJ (putative lipid II flippase)
MTLKIGVLTFIIVAVLSPFFAWSYGVPGLIVAFLIANIVGTTYGAYVAKKKHNVEFAFPAVMRIGLVALVSAVPLLLLRLVGFQVYVVLFSGCFLYLLLYFTLVPFMGIVTESEIENADVIVNRLGPFRVIVGKVLELERFLLRQALLFKQRNESSRSE